jgi:hypothetical protein
MHTRFWRKALNEGDYLEELGVKEGIIIKLITEKKGSGARTGIA